MLGVVIDAEAVELRQRRGRQRRPRGRRRLAVRQQLRIRVAHDVVAARLMRELASRGVGRPVLARVAFEDLGKFGRRALEIVMKMQHTFVLSGRCTGQVVAQPIIFADATPSRKYTKTTPLGT